MINNFSPSALAFNQLMLFCKASYGIAYAYSVYKYKRKLVLAAGKKLLQTMTLSSNSLNLPCQSDHLKVE